MQCATIASPAQSPLETRDLKVRRSPFTYVVGRLSESVNVEVANCGPWLARAKVGRLVVVLPEIFRVETTQLRPSSVGGKLAIDLAVDRIA